MATVKVAGQRRWGLLVEGGFADLTAIHAGHSGWKSVLAAGQMETVLTAAAGRGADLAEGEFTHDLPVPDAGKILCVGVNFPDRNAEYKDGQDAPAHMSLFVRFASSFTGHGQALIRPPESHQLDYEGEIAVVIGKGGRRIAPAQALGHIAALTLCNEGTIRDWVRHGKFNVTQGKNWDRSGAIGPHMVPMRDAAQLSDIALQTRVNGVLRQSDRTGRMLFSIAEQIAYISTFCTLEAGDIIVTGTPSGAGARLDPPVWLAPGDVVEVSADGIGVLSNGVADE